METSELRLILQNYYSPPTLVEYLGLDSERDDLYEMAIESILGEEEAGLRIMAELDEASAKQKEKIRSMNPREIRNSLSVEFLEPGKRLALIMWALLRDERLSARNHASTIAEAFAQQMEPSFPESGDEEQQDLIQEIAEEINEDIDEEAAAQEGIDIENADEDDVMEQILAELNSGTMEQEAEQKNEPETEPDTDLNFLDEDDIELEDEEEQDEISFEDDDEEDEEYDFAYELDLDTEEEEESGDEEEPLHIPDKQSIEEGMEEVDRLIANLEEPEEEEEEASSTPCITIGGVEISLDSLKRACERVFNETVELVTDENLTRQDKIVVIGKRCGLYVLQGPRYKIEPVKTTPLDVGDSIEVSPTSLQAALSRIYSENVELVPDPDLLKEGIVVFTGKETGLSVMQNSIAKVSLPNWVNEDLKAEIETPSAPVSSEISNLKQKIAELEERIEALSKQATAQESPQPETETKEEEHEISDEALSLDDIESEELEPIPEEIPEVEEQKEEKEEDEDIHEEGIDESAIDSDLEEILGAVSEGEEQSSGEDEINYEEMLKDFPEEESEPVADTETSEEESPEEEEDLSEVDLEDLDLEAITQEEEEKKPTEEATEEETSGGEEDELDLEGLMEDLESGEEGEEEEKEQSEEESSEDEDFDLDILSELEETTEEGSETKQVFNGEQILLLGGDKKHEQDYKKVVEDLGGHCNWRGGMEDANEEEINELVESADVIMTLSSEALSDPGILQATSYAQESNKRVFEHHSANPNSVQKKLTQLVEEGKV